MHRNSRLLFERYAKELFQPGMRVLEIGPDWHPTTYQTALGRDDLTWHTVDFGDHPVLTYHLQDEYHVPVEDDAYDIVLSGNVIEHVKKIWVWIKEVARVCKPGGTVITINPISWPFHENPVDCWRIYPDGMRTLYDEAGLEVDLAKCESLEGAVFTRFIAGRGRDWQHQDELKRTEELAPLGMPVECALDTITIGRKPVQQPLPDASRNGSAIAHTNGAVQPETPVISPVAPKRRHYGIYTAADYNFFPGVVVQLNSLRQHGYHGPLAVIDTGLEPWMADYLRERGVELISTDFTKTLRFTDVLTDETAGLKGWSFKIFGILHADLFENFTFIDADYIPLCNLEQELLERIERGEFLCTEDGHNTWDEKHTEAIGVAPGTYSNINAGFFSASMKHHAALLEEWRNLMTRRKPFDLWYGDQGALNAILDKYGIPKVLVGDKADWNQTWLNEKLAQENSIRVGSLSPPVLRHHNGQRIYGWHGCGWCRYWHCLGIDHFRDDPAEIQKMQRDCVGKVPDAVLQIFSALLFQNGDLAVDGYLLTPRKTPLDSLQELYDRSFRDLTDKGTAHSYIPVYEDLLTPYRQRPVTLLEIGVLYGGSLQLWAEFLPQAKIQGIDVDLSRALPSVRECPRIELLDGNATLAGVIAERVGAVDIVIDDASHVLDEQLLSFRALEPKLNPGGLYVIEDIWPYENALRLLREIPGAEIIDRREVQGRCDDLLVVYHKP